MIEIKYFGFVAEKTKCEKEIVSLKEVISLEKLIAGINEKHQLDSLSFSVAVNQKIISDCTNYQLKSNDIVALLPPFAGG